MHGTLFVASLTIRPRRGHDAVAEPKLASSPVANSVAPDEA
jgi:hypothetical protein